MITLPILPTELLYWPRMKNITKLFLSSEKHKFSKKGQTVFEKGKEM
jgi:hypothetical protein